MRRYFILALLLCSIRVMAQPTPVAPTGSGTSANPYLIQSVENLLWIANDSSNWSASYKQTANLDITASSGWNSSQGWKPIGNSSTPFSGTYDGDHFFIKGMYINNTTLSEVGLFGTISNASISNLDIVNAFIINTLSKSGALVGEALGVNGSIDNCKSNGTLIGRNIIGGLIGSVEYGLVTNCSSSAGVITNSTSVIAEAGGFVGQTNHASFQNCFASGSISASKEEIGGFAGKATGGSFQKVYATGSVTLNGNSGSVGGLIGVVLDTTRITNSYSAGSISADNNSSIRGNGGFIGTLNGNGITLEHTYSSSSISSSGLNTGGLVGFDNDTASTTIINSFWNTQTSGINTSAGGSGINSSTMRNQSTFVQAGWDFQCKSTNGNLDIWGIYSNSNSGFPFLSFQGLVSESCPTWVGTQNTQWNDTANWLTGSVPTGNDDVLILASATYHPILNTNAYAANLVVEQGASITIDSSYTLTVNSQLTNNGTITVNNAGSLLQPTSVSSISGNGTYHVYRETGPLVNNLHFQYWSSPIRNTTMGSIFTTSNPSDFYYFDEASQNWSSQNASAIMQNGRGYISTGDVNGGTNYTETRLFSGEINNGLIQLPIGPLANTDIVLVGNPYPSAISCAQFLSDNSNLMGTFYFWDHNPQSNQNSSADYASWNLSGGTKAQSGSDIPDGYVQTAQAFMVNSAVSGTFNINFNNGQRVAANNEQFFSPGVDSIQRIWLSVSTSNDDYNQLLIALSHRATDGFDPLYDGFKYQANPNLSFYSKLEDKQLSIQGLSQPSGIETKRIPLEMDAGLSGEYTIRVDSAFNFDRNKVVLVDELTETRHAIVSEEYQFSVDQSALISNRFYLEISTKMESNAGNETNENQYNQGEALTADERIENRFQVYHETDGIRIDFGVPTDETKEIQVYGLSGQLLYSAVNHKGESYTSIPTPVLSSGVYLVSIRGSNSFYTQKLFIQ